MAVRTVTLLSVLALAAAPLRAQEVDAPTVITRITYDDPADLKSGRP